MPLAAPANDFLGEQRPVGHVMSLFDSGTLATADNEVFSYPIEDAEFGLVVVEVTGAGGTLILTPTIQYAYIDQNGAWAYADYHEFAAITGNSVTVHVLGTSLSPSITTVNMNAVLPAKWRFTLEETSAFSSTVSATLHRMLKR